MTSLLPVTPHNREERVATSHPTDTFGGLIGIYISIVEGLDAGRMFSDDLDYS